MGREKGVEKTGNTYTGSADFFETSQIKNADGEVVATYAQISIDDRAGQYIFAIRGAVDPIPKATAQFFGISAVLGTGGGVLLCLGSFLGSHCDYSGITSCRCSSCGSKCNEKLRSLGISLETANAIIQNPASQKLIDNANKENINHVQEIGGKLIRMTTDPSGQRIISAGIIRAYSITNGIAIGRFTPKN